MTTVSFFTVESGLFGRVEGSYGTESLYDWLPSGGGHCRRSVGQVRVNNTPGEALPLRSYAY